jgi:hypothetical protein
MYVLYYYYTTRAESKLEDDKAMNPKRKHKTETENNQYVSNLELNIYKNTNKIM